MNRIYLIGRITAKPELNYTSGQMAVTKFTVAVDKGKDKGANFIRVTAFSKRAETICRYMDKGRQIAIEGHIDTGSYKDKDGRTVYTTDIIIDNCEFLGSGNNDRKAEEAVEQAKELFGFSAADDGIPF